MCLTDLLQTNFVDNQLTHEVHERVKLFNVHADTLTLMLLLRRGCSGLGCLFLRRGCCRLRCWSGGRCCSRRRRCFLTDLVRVNLLNRNVLDFRDGIHGILDGLSIAACGDDHIKAALKLLLLKILSRRNAFDDITDLIQCLHDHDGTRRLEDAGLHERNLDMEGVHPGFFCLFHNIEVNVIEVNIGSRSTICCRCRCRC